MHSLSHQSVRERILREKIFSFRTHTFLQKCALFIGTLLVLSLFLPADIVSAQSVSGESESYKVQGVIAVPIQVIDTVTTPIKENTSTVQAAPSVHKVIPKTTTRRTVIRKPIQKPTETVSQEVKLPEISLPERHTLELPKEETAILACEGTTKLPYQTANTMMASLIPNSQDQVVSSPTSAQWSLPTDETGALSAYMFLGFGLVLIFLVIYFYTLERKVSHIEDMLVREESPRRRK